MFYVNDAPWTYIACISPTNLPQHELVTLSMLSCPHFRWEAFQTGQFENIPILKLWNLCLFSFLVHKFFSHKINLAQSHALLLCQPCNFGHFSLELPQNGEETASYLTTLSFFLNKDIQLYLINSRMLIFWVRTMSPRGKKSDSPVFLVERYGHITKFWSVIQKWKYYRRLSKKYT